MGDLVNGRVHCRVGDHQQGLNRVLAGTKGRERGGCILLDGESISLLVSLWQSKCKKAYVCVSVCTRVCVCVWGGGGGRVAVVI